MPTPTAAEAVVLAESPTEWGKEEGAVEDEDVSAGWGSDLANGSVANGTPQLFEQMMRSARQQQHQPQQTTPLATPAPPPVPAPVPAPMQPMPVPPEEPRSSGPHVESLITSQRHGLVGPLVVGEVVRPTDGPPSTYDVGFRQGIVQMWDDREMCDLKLLPKPGDACISVHSVVVASASAEIKKVLANCIASNDSAPPELVIHVEQAALEELVRYMYVGEIRVSNETVNSLLHASEVLCIPAAMDLCVQWIGLNITADNALAVTEMADRFKRIELKSAVERFVLGNIASLSCESPFLGLPLERVAHLLSHDEACFANEVEVFRAVVRWVSHDISRTVHFADLMAQCVRLPLMTPEQLLDEVEVEELVRADPNAQRLVMDVYRYQALPESRRGTMQIPGTTPRTTSLHVPGRAPAQPAHSRYV